MIRVVFRVMARSFLRDRGALAMSFVLPLAVFIVFATIFAGASGEQLRISVALVDEQGTAESKRLTAALGRDPALTVTVAPAESVARARVMRGAIDAALIVRGRGRALGDLTGDGDPPIAIVVDPIRAVAGRVLAGQVQKAYFTALPDVALRSTADLLGEAFVTFTAGQRDTLAERFDELRREVTDPDQPAATEGPFDGLIAAETLGGAKLGRSHVAYYAGAVAMLFLLFSAVHGALTLLEERDAGVLDRLLAGPGGMGAVVGGKFLFLVVQGVAQVTVIFGFAWAVWKVPLFDRAGGYLLVTTAAAMAAAGLALALTTACRTRRQAQALANVAILILSAVGGSMVPRFFMPGWLQSLGWLTPTTWAVEAYSALFWRNEPIAAVVPSVGLLMAIGLVALVVSRWLARRDELL